MSLLGRKESTSSWRTLATLRLPETLIHGFICTPFKLDPTLAHESNQLNAALEQEKATAEAELEEELVKEACKELELNAQRQAR